MNSFAETYDNLKDKRVVLLQSGGLDSNVCAAILSYYGFEIHHVFVNYGQNSLDMERLNAHNISVKYGGKLYKCVVTLPWLRESSKLVGSEVNEFYEDGDLNALHTGVYVPMRNAFLLSIASSLADSLSIPNICCAFDGLEDCDGNLLSGTSDKHPTFVKKMEDALSNGSSLMHQYGGKFNILTPVMGMYKEDIVNLGVQYNADFSISWSCYNSDDKPCCKCSACRERARGFYLAGVEDPVMSKYGLSIPKEDLEI